MKRKVVFLIVLFLVSLAGAVEESLSPSNDADVSVTVDGDTPEIVIHTPENKTYNNLTLIFVNYTVRDVSHQATWYSLNLANNLSVSNLFNLSLAEGNYLLRIYANDSFGRENYSEVSFSVNNSIVYCGNAVCELQENCSSCVADCGVCQISEPSQGGGGRNSRRSSEIKFELDKEQIKVKMKEGETKRETLRVTNIGNNEENFRIEESFIEDFIIFDEIDFELNPGETKNIIIDFIASENLIPDLYIGEIFVKSGLVEKRILTAVEIVSRVALFDVRIDFDADDLTVSQRDNIKPLISIFSLGREGRVDVQVNYQIRDDNNEVISESNEMIAVDTQISFVREFAIPETNEGNYVFFVSVKYNGQQGSATRLFRVVEEKTFLLKRENQVLVLIFVLFVLLVYFIGRASKNKVRQKTKRK